jgi:hypothetical protein
VGNVASLEVFRDSISHDVEGFGLAELFVEAPVDPGVDDSTKLCDFLANFASKKQASKLPLYAPLKEICAIASVFFLSIVTVTMEGTQVDPDPVADKRNAFFHWFFGLCLHLSLLWQALGVPVLLWSGRHTSSEWSHREAKAEA